MEIAAVELGAIATLFVALVLAFWVYASAIMLRPIVLWIANVLNNIPAIGSTLSDALVSLDTDIVNYIQNSINDAWRAGSQPLVDAMTGYGNTKSGQLYSQSLVDGMLYNAVSYAIVHATDRVNSPTQSYVTNSSTVNNTYVLANTDAAVTQSEQYTQSVYGVLADWANSAIQSVYNDVVDSDGRIARLAADTAANIATSLDTAHGYATAAQENAVLTSEDYTKRSFTVLEGYVQDTQTWAQHEIEHSRVVTEDFVTTHEKALHDTVTAEMTATAAIATAVASDFADFMNRCGDPLCGGLTELAKGFMGMKDLLGTALLVGFIEEAIRNPEQTADATVAVADAITGPAKAIISSVFGG